MLVFLLVLISLHSVLSSLVVELPSGSIQGYMRKSPNGITFNAYQGIPYAKPPLGQLRFQPPQAVDNWDGIKEVTKDGNRCYSVRQDTPNESEDCLYLNVFTTLLGEPDDSTLLPVIVFMYGGGFQDGASYYNDYGPDYLIEEGVIVVTFNYRLGPFGFLSTGDNIIPGNYGLKDQLFALKWVQENIHLFGGDPDKVTLSGQSAGGSSVGLHILSKQSAGLFRAAIAESGSALSVWCYVKDPVPYGHNLALTINPNAKFNTSQQLLDYLRMVPAKDIDTASTKTTVTIRPLPTFEVESDDAFLTKSMYESLQEGDLNNVPLLIGTNSEEYIYLAADLDSLKQNMAGYDNNISTLVTPSFNINDPESLQAAGQAIKDTYLATDDNWQDNLGYSIAYLSDSHFYNGLVKHAELQSKYTDVYLYQFSYSGAMGNNKVNVDLEGADKVQHGEEMYYYFKRKDNNGYDNSDLSKFSDADVLTHQRIVKLWTNFAKYLNPTPDTEDPLLQNLQWPKVTPDAVSYVDIDTDFTIKTELRYGRYLKWTDTFEKYAVEPYTTF